MTRWPKQYEKQFYLKYDRLQKKTDKQNIKECTLKITNHPDPSNIGGCESCPSGDSLKLTFSIGWVIVYQVLGSKVHFLEFYRDVPSN